VKGNLIQLSVLVDEEVIARDKAHDLVSEDLALLRREFFEMPIQLIVEETDLVGPYPVPLLTVGPIALRRIEELPKTDGFLLELDGGDIYFAREGEMVLMESSRTDTSARVDYNKLLSAWQGFSENIRIVLADRFPELANHPFWGGWIKTGGGIEL
jgi:hypothetical protein